ncbi:DUF1579 domain-containing protein [Nubsella zeaxanthinifaciens]|jgi:hypothetical protein|uniref:DUF1579 domain-containing protein n=1 Tax=Nubsella zeaxanthinifaciens TaxID=392412 RepID=UPI000DE23BE0|nr:DUF1579 domain-containing protein [Nubsella zeaxanthinifaciens]
MRNSVMAASVLLLLASACSNDKKDKAAATDSMKVDTMANMVDTSQTKPIDSATAAKAWETYMKPGNEHQMLAQSVGNWNAEITFYSPSGEIVSTNTGIKAETKMILGGRYQQSTYKGQIDGMPFEGVGTTGFDNAKKVYVSTWMDNMGTGVMYLEGTFKESTKMLTSMGSATDVVTGKAMKVRETLTFADDNIQLMDMFDTKDGKEVKTMSIKLTRVK